MSVSEAARRFSAVLDGAEHGGTVVITRAGRRPDSARAGLGLAPFARDDVVLPAVTLAEYLTGVELDDHPARRAGCPHGAHDLIIGATARGTDRSLVSTDVHAGFGDLLEVQTQLLAQ